MKQDIFLIHLYTFLIRAVFNLPVFVVYYLTHLNLSFSELMLAQAFVAIVMIIMEVPSGWLSDVWSRKGTLILACVSGCIAYLILIFSNSFLIVALGQCLIGVTHAFTSGALTSFLHDHLAQQGKQDLYQQIEGKRHGISLYATASASVLGAILYQYSVYLPFVLDALRMVLAIVVMGLIAEPALSKQNNKRHPLKDMSITMRYALFDNKKIAAVTFTGMMVMATANLFFWVTQPYLLSIDIPIEYFGGIIAVGYLLGGLSSHLGHKIHHQLSRRMTMTLLIILTIMSGALAVIFHSIPAVTLILFVSGVGGYALPFIQNVIQDYADPTRRATILSVFGLLTSLVFIPSSFILGRLLDDFSVNEGIVYLVLQLAFFGGLGLLFWQKFHK